MQWQVAPKWWCHIFDLRRESFAETDDADVWVDNYLFIGPFQFRWVTHG